MPKLEDIGHLSRLAQFWVIITASDTLVAYVVGSPQARTQERVCDRRIKTRMGFRCF